MTYLMRSLVQSLWTRSCTACYCDSGRGGSPAFSGFGPLDAWM